MKTDISAVYPEMCPGSSQTETPGIPTYLFLNPGTTQMCAEDDASNSHDDWENMTADSSQQVGMTEPGLELPSLAIFGLGKKGPSHHLKSTKSLQVKKTSVDESSKMLDRFLTAAADDIRPTTAAGVVLEDRPTSRMTDVNV